MIIGRITSQPIPKLIDGKLEYGRYDLPIEVWLEEAEGDITGYINHCVAQYLAKCVQSTKVELGYKLWNVDFTQEAQRMFNLPAGFTA